MTSEEQLASTSAQAVTGDAPPARRRIRIGPLRVDDVDFEAAVARVADLVAAKRPAYVVTPNVDHVVRMQRDAAYAELVAGADLVVADGQPLVWASRLLGTRLPERVAGSDLFPRLCAEAAERGWRVFFMGGDDGVADEAAAVLTARHANLQVVGTHCPPMGFEQNPTAAAAAVAAVRDARPDIVFVGLGSPKQERWIAAHQHEYGPAVSLGIGISFSFVAGRVKRAPRWMQRAGLEWLHRLGKEPRRLWKRYLVDDPAFAGIVLRQWWRGGGRRDTQTD